VEGSVAHERVLTLGMHTPDGRVEVSQGLKPDELLVVRGAEPLSEGALVKIAAHSSLEASDAGVAPPAGAVAAEKRAPEKTE
jgi:hypothetical protein